MPAETWAEYRAEIATALAAVELDLDALCQISGALHFIGNGASASMASHMAADWLKTARVRAFCYNDAALMSACANDLGVEHVFRLPIERMAIPGDTLVAISASGESPNIIEGIKAARRYGCRVVTLTGKASWNRVRSLGDVNIYVPSDSYGIVETCHAAILHAWLDHYVSTTR